MKALKILKNLKKAFGNHDKPLNEAITELEALQAPKKCEWKMEDSDYNTYKTGCGQYFTLIEGDLKDNDIKFCSYCGGIMNELKENE